MFKCAFLAAASLLFAFAQTNAEDKSPHRLATHMDHLLKGSAQWRAPNPDFEPGNKSRPQDFGVNWKWGANNQHLVCEVIGTYEGRCIARYQSLIAILNTVTGAAITQQVGWDGAYAKGQDRARDRALENGESEPVDTLPHSSDGTAGMIRHVDTVIDETAHKADVYKRNAQGIWTLQRERTWRPAAPDRSRHSQGRLDRATARQAPSRLMIGLRE